MLLRGSRPPLQAPATQAGGAALTTIPHGYDQSAQPMQAGPSCQDHINPNHSQGVKAKVLPVVF